MRKEFRVRFVPINVLVFSLVVCCVCGKYFCTSIFEQTKIELYVPYEISKADVAQVSTNMAHIQDTVASSAFDLPTSCYNNVDCSTIPDTNSNYNTIAMTRCTVAKS